jgi:hypothetical protein
MCWTQDERRRFAGYTSTSSSSSSSLVLNLFHEPGNVKIKLNFNHPVKELWTVRDNANLSSRASPRGGPHNDHFNYAVRPGPLVRSAWTVCAGGNDLVQRPVRRPQPHAAKLQLNIRSFQPPRRPVQRRAAYYTTRTFRGINVYSFALKRDHQPSGSCNMSRIDNATLQLQLEKMATGSQVSVYATNYNVLRIMSGDGARLRVRIAYGYQWL